MNERDKWLDERIRRGVTAWNPRMPEQVEEELRIQMNASGGVVRHERTRSVWFKGLETAAALLAGAILLRVLLPSGKSPQITVMKLPKAVISYAAPPAIEITLPEPLPAVKSKPGISALPVKTDSALRPKQVDLMLSIPDKNITIVWCQRQDFDLLDKKKTEK